MAVIVRVNPHDSSGALLIPMLADRIKLYAQEHEPTVPADTYVATTMARLWARDPSILALALVDPDKGLLVGHVLADFSVSADPVTGTTVKTATVHQKRADGNVGDALHEAVDQAALWAKSLGADVFLVRTKRDSKEWEKRHELSHAYHVLAKRFNTVAP